MGEEKGKSRFGEMRSNWGGTAGRAAEAEEAGDRPADIFSDWQGKMLWAEPGGLQKMSIVKNRQNCFFLPFFVQNTQKTSGKPS